MPRTVHNLDIYPHSGPQCVGCIVLDDPEPGAEESAPLAEPATATDEMAAADDGPTASAPPPPEPKPHPLLRVGLDADVLVEDEGCRVAYSVRVTLYGRAAARARIVVRDRDAAALAAFEVDLTEGTALVRAGTAPLAADLDLIADATLVDDAAVTDSAGALVFAPVLALAESPAMDSVRLAAPPRWTTRASTGEEDAVRTPALLSSAEEGVVFVRPDVALDPPLRVEARGSGLTGKTATAALITPEGMTLAEASATCAEDDRVQCTFDRIPGAAFGKARVVRAFVRVSVDEVSAETPSPVTLVRLAPVELGDARPTQCTYDLVYTIMALGTPTIAPPAKARVSSMYRDAEHQLDLLRGFAHDLGIAHAGMKVEDVSTWGPVLDRV
ncbi:MAG TPA: hypothetical protein VG389_14175, partial [Myxococcota bacterium]|nr:hypothetical protein [Myxococcota bacterium]